MCEKVGRVKKDSMRGKELIYQILLSCELCGLQAGCFGLFEAHSRQDSNFKGFAQNDFCSTIKLFKFHDNIHEFKSRIYSKRHKKVLSKLLCLKIS